MALPLTHLLSLSLLFTSSFSFPFAVVAAAAVACRRVQYLPWLEGRLSPSCILLVSLFVRCAFVTAPLQLGCSHHHRHPSSVNPPSSRARRKPASPRNAIPIAKHTRRQRTAASFSVATPKTAVNEHTRRFESTWEDFSFPTQRGPGWLVGLEEERGAALRARVAFGDGQTCAQRRRGWACLSGP